MLPQTNHKKRLGSRDESRRQFSLGTVHFLRGRGGGGAGEIWGGSPKKKTALKGGHLKKIRKKGGSRKILPLLAGGSWEKLSYWGGHATF